MTATLDDCIKAIQGIVGAVEGIRAAPEYASDKIPPGVWSMAFPGTGAYENAPTGVLKGLHDITLYVYCPRVDLRSTLAKIIPLGDLVAAALESSPKLGNTCSTFGTITYNFEFALNVGTAQAPAYVTGWTFTISGVKIENTTAIT